MFKLLNGHTAPHLKQLFEINNDSICPYNLRNTQTDFAFPLPKKDFGKRCFNYMGASLWNNLPREAKIFESLSSFKAILKQIKNWLNLFHCIHLKVFSFLFTPLMKTRYLVDATSVIK